LITLQSKEHSRVFSNTTLKGLVHWDDPEGWYGEEGGRGGSGWGTRVHPWQIHVDVWQNQYNIVKYKKKKKRQKKSITSLALSFIYGPTLTSLYDYWKNHRSLTIQIFVSKVMPLAF